MNKDMIEIIAVIGGMVIGSAIGLGIYSLIDWLQWRRDKKTIDRLLEEDIKHKFEDYEREFETLSKRGRSEGRRP